MLGGDEGGHENSLGTYLAQIGRHRLLTRDEELRLAKRAESGDTAARKRLIESNLRLVVSIARTYRPDGLELLDLIQEGTLGLMRAVDRYDWRLGTRLSTYAGSWIRHGILSAIEGGGHAIRVPSTVRRRTRDVGRAERSLTASLGRVPSVAELAEATGFSPEQVLETRAASLAVASLDAPIGDSDELRYSDTVADPKAPDPLHAMIDQTPPIDLHAALVGLPARSRKVIELRYGLGDGTPRSADSVAAELGVARERVRTIELHTLRKLAVAQAALAA